MPRLGHKKSRLGCRQCKARHVKCDEQKPCSNCARHGVPCSLITDGPNASQLPNAVPSSSSSASTAPNPKLPAQKKEPNATPPPSVLTDNVLNPHTVSSGETNSGSGISDGSSPASQPDQFPFLTRFIHRSETPSDIWLRDLELMHHWTVEAFDQLSQRDDMRHTWRVDAPKHAVHNPFFMHEILAFSAFHKAYKNPDQRAEYYGFGIHHQDLAIRGMREKIQNVLPQEAAAIVATSTLLTLSVFASTGFEASNPEIAASQSPIDGILNIFNLMQGMGNVLAIAQIWVMDSFLAPMFRDSIEAIPSQPMLQELMQHLPTLVTFVETKRDMPEAEREVYLGVIGFFEPALQLAMPSRVDNRELRFLFFWPLHLDQRFFTYVRQKQSGALVILMYYAAMLFASEPRYWFMDGWGDRLMRACYESVEQSWVQAMQWPISFLNQDATYNLFADLVHQRMVSGGQTQNQPPFRMPHRQHPSAYLPQEQNSSSRSAPYPEHTSSRSPPEQQPNLSAYPDHIGLPHPEDKN